MLWAELKLPQKSRFESVTWETCQMPMAMIMPNKKMTAPATNKILRRRIFCFNLRIFSKSKTRSRLFLSIHAVVVIPFIKHPAGFLFF